MSALRSHTGATPITGEFVESHMIIRRRVATSDNSVEAFMVIMEREKFTGEITIQMLKGGVRAISAEDRQKITIGSGV